jgi:hypothetical protein
MSPHHHQVALDANLGGGWFARLAEFAEARSSIVLVTVERNEDRRSLRLDIGKGMFLDKPPAEVDQRAARTVTNYIVQQITPPRGNLRS